MIPIPIAPAHPIPYPVYALFHPVPSRPAPVLDRVTAHIGHPPPALGRNRPMIPPVGARCADRKTRPRSP